MTTPTVLTTEIQKLEPSAIIELFELDATDLGGDLLRFHAGTNQLRANVVWNGNTYTRFPIDVSGFEFNGQGQFPRPRLRVSNAMSAVTAILLAYGDLLGAKLTRRRTCAKFLDAVNFTGGVNADADPTAEFPTDVYYIDRKSMEDRDVVEFELAVPSDLSGVTIPRRQIIQNICPWKYRGTECGFTGAPVLDANDDPITTASTAEGQAVLDAYQVVLSAQEALATAETALSAAASAMGAACEYKKDSAQYSFDEGTGVLTTGVLRVHDTNTLYEVKVGGSGGITLGSQWRQGRVRVTGLYSIDRGFTVDVYEIEEWIAGGAACTAATTAYNTALSARDDAASDLEDAEADYDAALDDLPEDDPLYSIDRCGKRLASCKARFGENEPLPFGGFPGADLAK